MRTASILRTKPGLVLLGALALLAIAGLFGYWLWKNGEKDRTIAEQTYDPSGTLKCTLARVYDSLNRLQQYVGAQ